MHPRSSERSGEAPRLRRALYALVLLLAPLPALADGFGWFALATFTIVGVTVMVTAAIRHAMLPRFTQGGSPSLLEIGLLTLLDAGLFLLAVKLVTLFSPFREPLELLLGATLIHALATVVTNAYLVRGPGFSLRHAAILGGVFPLVFWITALSLFVPLQMGLRGG
jgi:hypothetical protein